MSLRRLLPVVCVCSLLLGCGKSPSGPSDPPVTVGPATPPVVKAITVPTSRVETGQDIAITAVVEDAETPLDKLAYVWSANVGTITGTGASAVWRHVAGLKSGADVVITLTVVDTHDAIVNNQIVQQEFRVVSQAAPFRVHDSDAETKELARKFLVDLFGNSTIAPEACLVDFSDFGICGRGKSDELRDITAHRRDYVVLSATIYSQSFVRTGTNSGEVHSDAEFIDRLVSGNVPHSARGDFWVTTVYEGNRWWLCESHFTPMSGDGNGVAIIMGRIGRGNSGAEKSPGR